eukprot:g248.t1
MAARALYRALFRSARRVEDAVYSRLPQDHAKIVVNGIAATLLSLERISVPKAAGLLDEPPTGAVRTCFRLNWDEDSDAAALDRGFDMLRSASHLLSALESPWGGLVLEAGQPGGHQASQAQAAHAPNSLALERGAVIIASLCSQSSSKSRISSSTSGNESLADDDDDLDGKLEREHEQVAEQLAQLARDAADIMREAEVDAEVAAHDAEDSADRELDPQQELGRAAVPAEHAQHTHLRQLVRAFFAPAPHGLGFRGDTDDYYNPMQSSLPSVLDRRAGLPITLAVVFAAVAARQTPPLQLQGVNTPAHFILRLDTDPAVRMQPDATEDERQEATGNDAQWPASAKPIFCDAFHGVLLSVSDVARRVKFALGGRLTQDDLERALEPVPAPLVWTRMLRNLAVTFADDNEDWHDQQKVTACEVAISHIEVLSAIARAA